jgi:elongation factor G
MKTVDPKDIRNIGLFAHQGSGKTSIGEAFLFNGKVTNRLCKVDEANSNFDFEPEEAKRRTSMTLSAGYTPWKKKMINILDTPGDSNFIADIRSAIFPSDSAVVVISAVDGVQVGTEKVWQWLDEVSLPRAVFINKLDRERANFKKALEEINKNFGNNAVPFFIPIGAESGFQGVVDILRMKAFIYEKDGNGNSKETEIPADILPFANEMREKLIEKIAEQDDQLIEVYFDKGELTADEITKGLLSGIMRNNIQPVLCGSALLNIGIDKLMDLIITYFPDPAAKEKIMAKNAESGEEIEWHASPDSPFAGYVFKTIMDPFSGKISVIKVISGTIKPDTGFYNYSVREKERFGSIYKLVGKKQEPVEEGVTGDIIAITKLKETKTGHTVAAENAKVVFNKIEIPPTAISFAIRPKTQGDEDKVSSSIQKMIEEDPGLGLGRDEQTKEFLLKGMGQIHIESTVERMKRKFGVDVEIKIPKVPYRETCRGVAKDIEGKHKKQTGGHGQFGVCYIDLEPLPRGTGFEFVNDIFGGSIPRQYIPSVEKGVTEAMVRGVIAGYPVVDVRVRLFDGKYHDVDSDNRSFELAGSKAFKVAFKTARPVLIEPIMNMEIVVPEENMGDIMGDINSKRGRILGMEAKGKNQVIKAQAPLAEILLYASDLRSITSGRGSYIMELSHYEEVPSHISEKIISASARKEEEEEE